MRNMSCFFETHIVSLTRARERKRFVYTSSSAAYFSEQRDSVHCVAPVGYYNTITAASGASLRALDAWSEALLRTMTKQSSLRLLGHGQGNSNCRERLTTLRIATHTRGDGLQSSLFRRMGRSAFRPLFFRLKAWLQRLFRMRPTAIVHKEGARLVIWILSRLVSVSEILGFPVQQVQQCAIFGSAYDEDDT